MERAIAVEVKMVISVYIILMLLTLNLILIASEWSDWKNTNKSSIRIVNTLYCENCAV
jgi:uncharacterized phage infection (PIP) family protein YhgE